MSSRRDFIKTAAFASAGLGLSGLSFPAIHIKKEFVSNRPKPADRKFVSEAVEAKITEIKNNLDDKELAWLFENCFPNTLDTTVNFKLINGKPDTFVITGDIEAMWLRDSSAQVYPYIPLCKEDEKLKQLIAGVINRQIKCILIDPYANAFNDGPTGGYWQKDITDMKLELHERKWEIDSLCYPIRLAYGYWKTTGDISCFDAEWKKAMHLITDTFKVQQRKENRGPYSFKRVTDWQTDTVPGNGWGNPIKPVGLIVSIFRPSDDASIFPFLIPSNQFAVVSLRQLEEIFTKVIKDIEFAASCRKLADEVENAIVKYSLSDHLNFGKIYSYEADGYGNKLYMDDANVPSLLSLPYLGYCTKEDPVYLNTRKYILSENNPYYFKGKAGEGIGSPHTLSDKIWPISIIMRALTSTDKDEIKSCIETIKTTHAGTGFMHESFHKDNPKDFSRKWFAWANTLFGELVIQLYQQY